MEASETRSEQRQASPPVRLQRRARIAALIVGSGLAVEAASLPWAHPLAFLSMTVVGLVLVVFGAVFYLWAEVSR